MVQCPELVHLAPPCPVLRVEIIAPLVRMDETDFDRPRMFAVLFIPNTNNGLEGIFPT